MSFRVILRQRVVDGLWQLKFLAYEMGQAADAVSRSVSEIAHHLGLDLRPRANREAATSES